MSFSLKDNGLFKAKTVTVYCEMYAISNSKDGSGALGTHPCKACVCMCCGRTLFVGRL